jgi:hypothetical protein
MSWIRDVELTALKYYFANAKPKSDSKADSFAVGRRQKVRWSILWCHVKFIVDVEQLANFMTDQQIWRMNF